LDIRGKVLREFLVSRGQAWREDASNQSERYTRNRVRKLLQSREDLHQSILELGRLCATYVRSARAAAPMLAGKFPAIALGELPRLLGRESARRWLVDCGVPMGKLDLDAIDRLRAMAADAATPSRQLFPGNVLVARRRGWIRRV